MSMTIGDADLIRSFQSGDHDVFAEIVRQYEDELIRHARRRVHDTGAAVLVNSGYAGTKVSA